MTPTLGGTRRGRLACAWLAAVLWHAALALFLAQLTVDRSAPQSAQVHIALDHNLTWINAAGPGGGGGGGGDQLPYPPRRLERAGSDRASAPAPPPAPSPVEASREPDPVDHLIAPVQPLGDALASLPGVLDALPAQTTSRGSGTGPGAGDGRGKGLGVGDGDGLEDGDDRGFGGGRIYRPGNDVVMPVAVYMERPRYSSDAMRARIQGTVVVECVVRVSGRCSDIHVAHSLDPRFGLDEEAKRAAALWRFRPGTRFGEPVPVSVRIELAFSVR